MLKFRAVGAVVCRPARGVAISDAGQDRLTLAGRRLAPLLELPTM